MVDDTSGTMDGLEPGDLVYLSLAEDGTDLGTRHPFRETCTVLIGSGHVPALEEQLVGSKIGDSGRIEVLMNETGEVISPTKLNDALPEWLATVANHAGIETPWEFVKIDPVWLEEEFMLDADRVGMFQQEVEEMIESRRSIGYTIVEAYRWFEPATIGSELKMDIPEDANDSSRSNEDTNEIDISVNNSAKASVDSRSVEIIDGIDSAITKRLAEAGIETVEDLAAADISGLAASTDLSEKRIARYWASANDHLV